MTQFRNINYGRMLYESMRNYWSVNAKGSLSILFKFMSAVIQPLQKPFNDYAAQRQILWLIANCKWQVGQLTNVLNFIYDPTLKRIYITQSVTTNIGAPKFPYTTHLQAQPFGGTAAQGRKFLDSQSSSLAVINIPSSVNLSAITATIELIRLQGRLYTINVF